MQIADDACNYTLLTTTYTSYTDRYLPPILILVGTAPPYNGRMCGLRRMCVRNVPTFTMGLGNFPADFKGGGAEEGGGGQVKYFARYTLILI